jgi:hypothetical protein
MNRQRIIEILEAYRPGEDLESDPEVRQALELAATDEELMAIRREAEAFDKAFSAALDKVEVPEGLHEQILRMAGPAHAKSDFQSTQSPRSNILQWLHPAMFGAAAAIVILLALTFTFWDRPGQAPIPEVALAQDPISATARAVYASLNPAFRSRKGSAIQDYLRSQNGGAIPASLPGNVIWDKAFACDVIKMDGYKVSIVCFRAPDNSKTMHLFTFLRSEFPDVQVPLKPRVSKEGKACCATWGTDDQVHVLYSDKGEENLRQLLDI